MSAPQERPRQGGLADDLIREASEHAVARSSWMRKRQEAPAGSNRRRTL